MLSTIIKGPRVRVIMHCITIMRKLAMASNRVRTVDLAFFYHAIANVVSQAILLIIQMLVHQPGRSHRMVMTIPPLTLARHQVCVYSTRLLFSMLTLSIEQNYRDVGPSALVVIPGTPALAFNIPLHLANALCKCFHISEA